MSAQVSEQVRPESIDLLSSTFDPLAYSHGKSHFQVAFFFTSEAKRHALDRLYAFCRFVDDITDQSSASLESRRAALRGVLEFLEGKPSNWTGNFWEEWKKDIEKFSIPKPALTRLVQTMIKELNGEWNLETWTDLEAYAQGVAGDVGTCVLAILGMHGDEAEEYAHQLGICVQYLNIMRDLDEDFALSRVYVPREIFERLGVSDYKNMTNEQKFNVRQELYEKALEARSQAKPLSWSCLPAEIMVGIYVDASKKYWRWGEPTRLKFSQKLSSSLKSCARFVVESAARD